MIKASRWCKADNRSLHPDGRRLQAGHGGRSLLRFLILACQKRPKRNSKDTLQLIEILLRLLKLGPAGLQDWIRYIPVCILRDWTVWTGNLHKQIPFHWHRLGSWSVCLVLRFRSYVTENRYCIDEFILRLCRRSWVTGSFCFGLIYEVGSNCNFSQNRMPAIFQIGMMLQWPGIFTAFPMQALNTAFPMQALRFLAVSQRI